jgi:hypothetical protein
MGCAGSKENTPLQQQPSEISPSNGKNGKATVDSVEMNTDLKPLTNTTQDRPPSQGVAEEKLEISIISQQTENFAAYVVPLVGFVIKTKRKYDETKVFINLFHHEFVAPIASTPAKTSTDKSGKICNYYDVIVNSSVFMLCMDDDVVHHQVSSTH